MIRRVAPVVFILLAAFALRAWALTDVPPGLTHDEANHGRDAILILDGVLLFYFPLNYGSEPLYNYLVAGNMALVGESLLALRLVNVYFGLLTVAAMFRWTYRAFDRQTALLVAALLALSFWPVVTSRQALRAGLLPLLMTVAVIFFWRILGWYRQRWPGEDRSALGWSIVGFAVLVAATLHTYLAARVLWFLFPLFIAYLLVRRRRSGRAWAAVLLGLLVVALLVLPMFAYVDAHPEAETRLQMLDRPLQQLASGQLGPILENAAEALLAFVWPGYGDQFLAYNIPGRPVLNLISAVFFVSGLVVCLWRWRRPAYVFALGWFLVGIVPSLITGSTANTTRNMGALPATYLLAALGFMALARMPASGPRRPPLRLADKKPRQGRLGRLGLFMVAVWLLFTAAVTARDYFQRWANAPEVRAAYQHTLVTALNTLAQRPAAPPTVISTVYPGPAHDPSIAMVLFPTGRYDLRWVDARYALILPNGQSARLLVPASTPLHPAFKPLTDLQQVVQLRADDLDPAFAFHQIDAATGPWLAEPANFGNAVTLLGARWLASAVGPGETAELLTVWRVDDPSRVGPPVPPHFETEVVMFTHVLAPNGAILTQRDSLEAPSWDWVRGDVILQVHPLSVPGETAPGQYETVVGLYEPLSGQRLPRLEDQGDIAGDSAFVVPLTIHE